MAFNGAYTGPQVDAAIAAIIGLADYIGVPGTAGFGVSPCAIAGLPTGMTALAGCYDSTSPNYGNYQFADGSIMCYVPKFWYKIGTGSNGLPVNRIGVKWVRDFADTAAANAAGYALHRAFIDGGVERDGFFVDKYMCSKNAWGAGFIASSIEGGVPISMHADHNPVADLTACSGNYYYEAINAAHARDGVDGAVNSDSQFFCASRFIYAALAMLSIAHGQAANGSIYCAWHDASGVTNFPKGCNNNALGDTNDGEVSYQSDGYSNCGKTGSGVPFAKTTHNGQSCGVADLNGLMYEISLGVTCVATGKAITGATQANPCLLTVTSHGRATGDQVMITSVAGMEELNGKIFTITVVDADTISLDGVDSSAFAAYTSGGAATFGDFYVAKESTAMRDFTSGNSVDTDHWGATGVAAMMEALSPAFEAAYPNNGFSQRIGDGAGQVLSEAQSGNDYALTGLGLPKDSSGISTSGVNLFGSDFFYQHIRNELCLLSCANWGGYSDAGASAVDWSNRRANSGGSVGFRAACFPVG